MSILSIFLATIITINSVFSATQTFIGSPGATITLGSELSSCVVECSEEDQCKELNSNIFTVNSECGHTTINCGKSSCKNAIFNIGSTNGTLGSVTINCFEASSCYGATINIIGTFNRQPTINGFASDSLKNAEITCLTGECIISCDNIGSCDECRIDCSVDSQCICIGGSCLDLSESTLYTEVDVNTPAPTQPTLAPTETPTSSPSIKPTESPTSSTVINYIPDDSGIFICKNNVGKCILDCDNSVAQCDQNTVLLSAADVTECLCTKKDACKNIQLYFGEVIDSALISGLGISDEVSESDFINPNTQSIIVNCTAKAACYNGLIKANVSVSDKFLIDTNDAVDALKGASIEVDVGDMQECEVDCGGSFGCLDTNFIGDTLIDCECIGSSCLNARIGTVYNIPNNENMPNNLEYVSDNYTSFLPTIIIICISIGLVCLVSFCIYYRYITRNNENSKMLANNVRDYGRKSLEMDYINA